MIKARAYVAGIALAAASAAAHAGLTFTPTVVSDYDFRGMSQSATDPAIQAGLDYTTGGLHLGAWASNIDGYGDADIELDFLADYTFGSDETVKVTPGIVYYTYPGEGAAYNTAEWFVTLAKSYFSGSVRYSDDWFGFGSSLYYELNGAFPLGESGFSVLAHVGRSTGDAFEDIEYTDYSLGVAKSFGKFNFTLKGVGSDFDPEIEDDLFNTETRVILSVSTTLPWSE